ncbi:hypothetical protein RSAG8_08898, partial [Rhizoctonia solani AG-8 WAC10335]
MLAACGQVQPILLPWTSGTSVHHNRSSNWFNQFRIYKFEDNTATIQSYTPGQVVNIDLNIINHHPSGYANVSVINSATNTRIGEPLIAWNPYFGSGYPYPKSEENFNVTIPELNGKCKVAGECVIQDHQPAHRFEGTGNE